MDINFQHFFINNKVLFFLLLLLLLLVIFLHSFYLWSLVWRPKRDSQDELDRCWWHRVHAFKRHHGKIKQ